MGTTVISGHFDKRIRFWDTRTGTANEIALQGKVTSLDHYPGASVGAWVVPKSTWVVIIEVVKKNCFDFPLFLYCLHYLVACIVLVFYILTPVPTKKVLIYVSTFTS